MGIRKLGASLSGGHSRPSTLNNYKTEESKPFTVSNAFEIEVAERDLAERTSGSDNRRTILPSIVRSNLVSKHRNTILPSRHRVSLRRRVPRDVTV